MSDEETKKEINTEEAKAILEKERQERVKRCAEKISAILKEENCSIDVSVIVNQKGNTPLVNIVAL